MSKMDSVTKWFYYTTIPNIMEVTMAEQTRYDRWTFTFTQEEAEWLKKKSESGYNVSKLMRLVLDSYIEREKETTENNGE